MHKKRNSARNDYSYNNEIYLGNGEENNERDGSFKVMDLSQVMIDESNRR